MSNGYYSERNRQDIVQAPRRRLADAHFPVAIASEVPMPRHTWDTGFPTSVLWPTYNLSAAHPSESSKYRVETINRHDRVAIKMTSTEIAEAQRLAREWTPK